MTDSLMRLLEPSEPGPVIACELGRRGPFLFVCDHAGAEVPRALGDLGAPPEAFCRHIAIDIGAAGLAHGLADRLDGALIQQRYSRLVIDCNRAPDAPDAIVAHADGMDIPGNVGLSDAQVAARVSEIHTPYHAAIAAAVDARLAQGDTPALVFVHSFTPRFRGHDRPWRVGVLHHGASPLSSAMLAALGESELGPIGDNEPYQFDGTDYTAPRHAIARGLDYVELEIRQDLIADAAGQRAMAEALAPVLRKAQARMGG
jgi:predicted N-formylglutamate amidohydrolase